MNGRSDTTAGREPCVRGAGAGDAAGTHVGSSSPWQKSPLHSSGDASRLTALFVGYICPICALLTPGYRVSGRLAALGATRGFTTGC